MKEAAGEANMTIITVLLIAVVLAAGTFIINEVLGQVSEQSVASSGGGNTWTPDN